MPPTEASQRRTGRISTDTAEYIGPIQAADPKNRVPLVKIPPSEATSQ